MKKDQSGRDGAEFYAIGASMGRAVVTALAALLLGVLPAAAQSRTGYEARDSYAAEDGEEYRLEAGDAVTVTYPYNAELNYEGTVGPDGRLTLPLIGSVPVAGLTAGDAQRRIAAALRRERIVEDARPSLAIRTYGASVFVGGEVRTPGAVRLSGPMDAMRAVILAGGVTDSARSKKVVVIRQMPDGSPSLRYVDLRAYVKSGGVGQDAPLRSHDVVFVPRSSVAEANLWIEQHINRMLPFSRSLNFNVGDVGARTVIGN